MHNYWCLLGTDHTGQTTMATSQGIVIDTTSPRFGRVWLNTPTTKAITDPSQLVVGVDWVVDKESIVESLYVSLGSKPGYGDLHAWQEVNGTNVSLKGVVLPDGQRMYLSMMVSERLLMHAHCTFF